MLKNFLAVGLGGALGAMLRYAVTVLAAHLQWSSNVGTIIVNTVGSFVMGLLISGCQQGTWLLLATVGICGGFTTFSTFSMQSITLLQEGKYLGAAAYIALTLILCLLLCWAGCALGKSLR